MGTDNTNRFMDIKIKATQRELINSIEDLISDLSYESKRLKMDENYQPNSLGILQSYGNRIDTLCAKLSALRDARELYE